MDFIMFILLIFALSINITYYINKVAIFICSFSKCFSHTYIELNRK